MARVKYGSIETEVKWQWPSKEIFENWKKDFFQLEETKYFKIYLVGGFLDKLNGKKESTPDVDIILTGNSNKKQIEKLIYEGTRLGIEKYNVFFDILWFEKLRFYKDLKKGEILKINMCLLSDKWIIDGVVKKQYHNAVQVEPNLWQVEMEFPTIKQRQLMDSGHIISEPILIFK